MRKHTPAPLSTRAAAVILAACTALGTSLSLPATAFADPAPKPNEPCVPVRIISADGTWAKGDKNYLQDVIAKAKQKSGAANISDSVISVDDPTTSAPPTPTTPAPGPSDPPADENAAKNALTDAGIKTVVKLWNPLGEGKEVQLGTADQFSFFLGVSVNQTWSSGSETLSMNDAGVKSLLDDGWIPFTPAVAKVAASQRQEAGQYRWAAKNPPVLALKYTNGYRLYYRDAAARDKAKSELNKDWMVDGFQVRIEDKTLGSKAESLSYISDPAKRPADSDPDAEFIQGSDYLKKLRDLATSITVSIVMPSNKASVSMQVDADKKAMAASKNDQNPGPVTIPADPPPAPDLPPVPDPWGGTVDNGDTPTVTDNGSGDTTETPAPTQTPAAGKNDETLDGVPGGSGDTEPTTDAGPTVATNANAPTATTSTTPSNISSDTSTTSSPSDTSAPSSETSAPSSSSSAPTTDVSEEKPTATYTPANDKKTGDPAYDTDKDKTKRKLAETMKMVHTQCPQTFFVLLGARQGAGAIGDLAADIGNGNGPVPAEKVIAVGLLSDPERSPMSGRENTVPDANKLCVMDETAMENPAGTPTSTTPTAVGKGEDGTPSEASSTPPSDTSAPAKPAAERTLGKSCSGQQQRGGPGGTGQLIGDTLDGAGIYGQRTMGFGALSGRTATICVKSDANCAASRDNTLVPLLARALTGDKKASPAAMQAAMQSATGLMKVLAALDFGQVTAMSSDVQKVSANAPLLAGALGTLIAAPNPVSAGVAGSAAVPTAQGILGIGGGVLKIASNLVNVYESTPELPQIVDFINLMNPDTKTGKDLLAHIPGGNSPQTVAALRAVIPVLNALNAIPKGQVLSLGGDISKTIGKALTNPNELVTLLSQSVELFTTVTGAATGVQPGSFQQVSTMVNPYPLGDKGSATTQAVDYSSESVNRTGTSATDWLGEWIGSQSTKAVQQVGTSGVSGDATFGGQRPQYSGQPG